MENSNSYCHRIIAELEGVDKWCRSHYQNKYDEDITSEVKYIAIKKGKFEERGTEMKTWLIDIAQRQYLKKFKYERFHPLVEKEIEIESECYQNESIGTQTILKLIENMHPRFSEVLMLTIQGYGVQEIAKIKGQELTTIKSKKSLARKLLKQQLELV